ncbi:thiamine phosphate synthase [Tateyamaria sp. SN3-11]|uniref:thiamine phosphate synthase n=1 Tax=Tateyamaria sp. SN3-11 TaxID=3092147 RepID=UPI0039E8C438
MNADSLLLYLVTDRALCAEHGVVDTVAASVRGGVSFVQLRDKTATMQARIELARALKQTLDGTGIPLVINDDLTAAVVADVDGVHIGQDDIAPAQARAQLGPHKLVGLSCETVAQVRAADPTVVDYLGLGTVFATATKADHKPEIGLSGLADLAAASALPTVAIGGLKQAHCADVLAAGCNGMAVVSAICGQPDPHLAAATLRTELETHR